MTWPGAGVTLSVAFDCQAGWTGGVTAEAAQAVQDDRLATGSGFSDEIDCAAGEETVEVTLMGAGDFAYTEGDALVRLHMFSCDATGETCEGTEAAGLVQFQDDRDR